MGADAKAILFGKVSHEEIAAVISATFPETVGAFTTDVKEADRYVILRFPEPNPTSGSAKLRQLFIFDGSKTPDDSDVYDGTRTLLNLGVWGSSTEILKAVTAQFGGYLITNDSDSTVTWEAVASPSRAFEGAEPKDRLRIALARHLPVKIANELSRLADDEGALDKTLEAYATYKKERDIVDTLEVDGAEPEIDYNGDGKGFVTWRFGAGPTVDISLTWTLPDNDFNGFVRTAPDAMSDTNKTEQAPAWLIEVLKKNVSDNPGQTFATIGQQVIEEMPSHELSDEMKAKVDQFLEQARAEYDAIPVFKI
jgi:hypothetical protein